MQFLPDPPVAIDNDLDHINKDDRAALINMAQNLVLARIILSETMRTSWRLIWEVEMESRFRSAAIPTPEIAKTDPQPSTTAIAQGSDSSRGDQLRFGRFLSFTPTGVNLPTNLTEWRFRKYWERTPTCGGNERL